MATRACERIPGWIGTLRATCSSETRTEAPWTQEGLKILGRSFQSICTGMTAERVNPLFDARTE